MSTPETPTVEVSVAAPSGRSPRRRGDWRVTWQGLRTVAQLELRQRVRSTRWKVALVVWFVVVGVITGLTTSALHVLADDRSATDPPLGPMIYGIVVFFVLFLGLLVSPTLSAAAINGDRNAGTLATLQATLLSPAEIVLGKLLAAWVAALAFLLTSVPFILWALASGGVGVLSLVTTLLMLAAVLLVVCAIGLGFSALVTKTSGSAVLTYLTIGGLAVVAPVLFGLSAPLVTTTSQVRVWTVPTNWDYSSNDPAVCEWQTQEQQVWHSERTWWLLAPNPFVIVADAQPLPEGDLARAFADDANPLAALQFAVRYVRAGAADEFDYCTGNFTQWNSQGELIAQPASPVAPVEPSRNPVWPWGLGLQLLLGAGGVVLAVNRLRIPTRTLPRGTRVA
ncbi:ABC transporter permease [Xylanimonas ulmi]|uniref:ABC-type transport system involved in multi-copper enzyme maturation permease subunit n=1 Tax=Xylanimonas ulmi TaxID=228973 RepID=A0A4Q7M863_9MICO|nr:ABC transporter permease subunit [Xylanibacterium ulmi]RZS62888.1 ABC-type transport system involved in multi-copper enzyme maturation permease subunit [Xylanibacterium ulmi]